MLCKFIFKFQWEKQILPADKLNDFLKDSISKIKCIRCDCSFEDLFFEIEIIGFKDLDLSEFSNNLKTLLSDQDVSSSKKEIAESYFFQRRNDVRSNLLDEKAQAAFVKEPEELVHLQKTIDQSNLPPINIGNYEGSLIYNLLTLIGAKKGIEIGTLGGYSAGWILKALEFNGGGELITIEKDPVRAQLARDVLQKLEITNSSFEVRTGSALEVLENLNEAQDLDFVFVDADKQNYDNYYKWSKNRIRKGGILIADNAYLWGGMYYFNQESSRAVSNSFDSSFNINRLHRYNDIEFTGMNAFWLNLSQDSDFCVSMIPTGEGLLVAQKI